MKSTGTNCQASERFLAFLRNDMTAREELDMQLHLEVCARCRAQLEEVAAERGVWAEAKVFLGSSGGCAGSVEGDGLRGEGSEGESPSRWQIREVLGVLGPTDDPDSLGRLDGYEITGVVGAGGMGVVLKAHERVLERVVAIKVLAPHLASSGSARKRFAREAKAAAAVIHPNVMAIHGVSNDGVLPYLVMPYVAGESLQCRLDREGPMSTVDILRIGSQLASGLAAAHQQGLVHRDIKPANILMDQGTERVSITDFGLARAVDDASMTRTGVIAGTPQFMSPEQASGGVVDFRSDLFSLGSVLYVMSTGRAPFRAEHSYGVLRRIMDEVPRPIAEFNPEIPEWLAAIIDRLMRKDRDERFGTASEVSRLLERSLAYVQNPATMPMPVELQELLGRGSGPFSGLGKGVVMMGSLMAILVGVWISMVGWWPAANFLPEGDGVGKALGGANATMEPVAVVMVMHPAELRNGNLLQRVVAASTLRSLQAEDYCGLLRYGGGKAETNWLWGESDALQQVGEHRQAWMETIAKSTTGDFPDFEPAFNMALEALKGVPVKQKMMIVFTDGDPVLQDETLLEKFREAKIRVSIVQVDIHQLKPVSILKRFAQTTGGSFYYALPSQADVAEQHFVQEVQILRGDSGGSLDKVALGFHLYLDRHGVFPGSRNRRLGPGEDHLEHPFSWRVAILPYIGQQALFEEYRFDEPWDSENNRKLLRKMPQLYRSPHVPQDQLEGHSHLSGFAMERGGLGVKGGEGLKSFTDGAHRTILVVETAKSVPWTQPEDLQDAKVEPIPGRALRYILADGSVGEMETFDRARFEKMITRDGGEGD